MNIARSDGVVSALESPLRIQPVTPALLLPMTEFGAVHYPPGNPNLDEAYLHWLCLENPAGPAQAIVIEDQGRMVGLALLIPIVLCADGGRQSSYFVVNVLTHPDYRNRRLFSRIIDAAKSFCVSRGEWLMGHPNPAAVAGWKRKEMTFHAPLVARLGGLGFGLGRRTTYLDSEQNLRNEWPAVAAALTLANGEVGIERSVEFMLWRFLTRPDRTYRLAMIHGRDGRLAGFRVTRRFKPFLDLLVDHGVAANGPGAISIDRPCLTLAPADRCAEIGAETGSLRLPVHKQMPFFASCFSSEPADFSRVTLAASDF